MTGALLSTDPERNVLSGDHGPEGLAHDIIKLGRAVERQLTGLITRSNMSWAEWRVMHQLHRSGPLTSAAVSSRSLSDRAEVSRAIAKLEQRQMLRRRPDPGNPRSCLMELNRAGVAEYVRFDATVSLLLDRVMRDMPPREARSFDRAMLKLARRAAAYPGPEPR